MVEWQWTKKEATLAFRNPRRDAVLFFQADNPGKAATAATAGRDPARRPGAADRARSAADGPVHKIPLTAAAMGAGDMVELRLVVDQTFVPALEPGAQSATTRANSGPACSTPSCSRRGRSRPPAMEFRCRLGTAGGQVIEGVYVAPSEAHLRRELEEKGLHVLSLAPRGGVPGLSLGRRTITRAGVPDLQPGAGDAAQGRHAAGAVARHPAPAAHQPGVQGRARRRAREGARRHRAVRRVRRARRPLSGVYTASLVAGERSGNLDAVLRRFVAYSKVDRHGPAQDALGAALSGHPRSRWPSCWSASSSSRSCRRSRASTPASTRSCRSSRASSSAISDFVRANLLAARRRARRRRRRASSRGCGSRASGRGSTAGCCALPVLGADRPQVRDLADRAHAGGALGGGIPLVNALDTAATSTGNRYLGARAATSWPQRVREGRGFAGDAARAAGACPTWPSR